MRNLHVSRNSRVGELNWKKLVDKKIINSSEREVNDSRFAFFWGVKIVHAKSMGLLSESLPWFRNRSDKHL